LQLELTNSQNRSLDHNYADVKYYDRKYQNHKALTSVTSVLKMSHEISELEEVVSGKKNRGFIH